MKNDKLQAEINWALNFLRDEIHEHHGPDSESISDLERIERLREILLAAHPWQGIRSAGKR